MTSQARTTEYRLPLTALIAIPVFAVSVWLTTASEGGKVRQIVVTKRGPVPDFVETPDMYLVIHTANQEIRTQTYENVPVGNGLAWTMPGPVPLSELTEVWLCDEDFNPINSDDALDRVVVDGRKVQGQIYDFEFQLESNRRRVFAMIAAVASGLYCLYLIGVFVGSQVI